MNNQKLTLEKIVELPDKRNEGHIQGPFKNSETDYEFRMNSLAQVIDDINGLGVTFKGDFKSKFEQFLTAPASTKYHGNYEGGLFDHSYEVMKSLVELTKALDLKWEREASPYIVGLFHDWCKIDSYVKEPEGSKYPYRHSTDLLVDGHGAKSVIELQQYIDLTEEEMLCILWHMGSFETSTEKWNYYGRAVSKYPNVLFTHTADMIASKIKDV